MLGMVFTELIEMVEEKFSPEIADQMVEAAEREGGGAYPAEQVGLMVARQFHHMREFTFGLAAFGLYMPVVGALSGLAVAAALGLDQGTGALFVVLCASASYIAVPAAMRLALPQAKAAIYLPLSLAITFPFNIVVGLPLYVLLAENVLAPAL